MKRERMRYDEFRAMRSQEPGCGNRKVLNARRVERDGVIFASRLEQHMYNLLTMHGIRFEFQKRYTLLDGFRYNGDPVRPITYTVDFWLPDDNLLVDTKGVQTQQGVLRIKLLKYLFATRGINTRIALPEDRAACAALVRELLDARMSSKRTGEVEGR